MVLHKLILNNVISTTDLNLNNSRYSFITQAVTTIRFRKHSIFKLAYHINITEITYVSKLRYESVKEFIITGFAMLLLTILTVYNNTFEMYLLLSFVYCTLSRSAHVFSYVN